VFAAEEVDSWPIMVLHRWCPFTAPAEQLWRESAEAAGKELRVVFAHSEEGGRSVQALDVRGVPCVVVSTDRRHYGMMAPDEAIAFLRG